MWSRTGRKDTGGKSTEILTRALIRRADAARDEGRFRDAAILYSEALRDRPSDARIHVQCGHMHKESGGHAEAEAHYLAAEALTPDDPDLALQLGHFYRSTGRMSQAFAAYRRAAALRPGTGEAQREIQRLTQAGLQPMGREDDGYPPADISNLLGHDQLAIEAIPRPKAELLNDHPEGIELKRLGRRERTHWGILRCLRGVEALRGFCLSATPIVEVQILLNGQLVYRGAPQGGYPVAHARDPGRVMKYVFNFWLDFSDFVSGRYEIGFVAVDAQRRSKSRHEAVVIGPALNPQEHAECDGVVPSPPADSRTPDQWINSAPTMIRTSTRTFLLQQAPTAVLIQRMDQLGDMVVSVPALRRLRAILPGARLVGLLSAANVDLARTLNVFDEIIVVDFADDPWERRRTMSLEAQEELRARLAVYKFDMAIDLAENSSSRPLLTLSGAPFLVGFRSHEMPGLRVELEGNTHDVWDGHEVVPHTNKLMGLVEWLDAMLKSHSAIVRRPDLDRSVLETFGLHLGDRFAVIHDGARLKFSRWPHYTALAEMMLDQTDLKVVMLTDSPGMRAELPPSLSNSDRFELLDRRLEFDQFDALLSYCSVFIGNDSGPKHLASLRGENVVSIHMARNNWNEWGQENGGLILSRRVPCAGCLIWHDPEECGKDFACIRGIKPEEVMRAVLSLL